MLINVSYNSNMNKQYISQAQEERINPKTKKKEICNAGDTLWQVVE